MTDVLTREDCIRQIKKRIRILKRRPEKSKKELFFARLLPDGSIHTPGHIAEGGVDLESLKVRIVPDVIIGYVDEKKVAKFKGVILDSLQIETFLRLDERFRRWPFKTSALAHGEYHRKVAENWWRDEAPPIIADILERLEKDMDDAWDKRGDMNTREAQGLINRKMPGIISELKRKFKDEARIYPVDEPAARKAQLAAGPIHIYQNFQIAALVNIKFGLSTQKIKKIQEIVGTKIDAMYGKRTLEAVRKYQKHLAELGLYEGPEDGLWDATTEMASIAKGDMPSELEQLRKILADLEQEARIYMNHLKYHTEQTNIFYNALGYRKRVHMASKALFEIGSLMLTISTLATLAEGFVAVRVAIIEAKKGLVAWEVVKGGAKIAAKKAARRVIWRRVKTHARQAGLQLAMRHLAIRLKKQREEARKSEDAYLLYHYLRYNAMRKFVIDIFRDIDKERKEVLEEIARLQKEDNQEQ